MPEALPSTQPTIARDLYDFYQQDPDWLIDVAKQRAAATKNHYIADQLERDQLTSRWHRLRAHDRLFANKALREGIALGFLFHDTAQIVQGESVPTVDARHFYVGAIPAKHNLGLYRLAQENLTKEGAEEIARKGLVNYLDAITFPLLYCAMRIIEESPSYALTNPRGQAFLTGVIGVDSALR